MYLNEPFAQVYDHPSEANVVVLRWGKQFIWLAEGQAVVMAVLSAVREKGKTGLLAYIDAEGFDTPFLDWLVENWYKEAFADGLKKIAHKMGAELFGQLSAEQVAYEDKSGIQFRNFYKESEEEIINWLKS